MRVSQSNPATTLPLVGRSTELELIRSLLRNAASGSGGTLILSGGSGVGKSRLLQAALEEAARHEFATAIGRAYTVEAGIPYAPFADAFVPLLRGFSEDALATLTRGGEAELAQLFPVPGVSQRPGQAGLEGPELKSRLLWNFCQFLSRLADRQPVLLVLDDLQWADASSLELLHFLARQVGGERVAVLCAYNSALAEEHPTLLSMEQSLNAIGAARSHSVAPLSHGETGALLRQVFGASESTLREFAALLFGWTRGNPFFLDETLKSLINSGRLYERDGSWTGWDIEDLELPRSIRDAVLSRLRALAPPARNLADLIAVIGTSVDHDLLLRLSEFGDSALVTGIDELRRSQLLEERLETDRVMYDFTHPVVRDVLYTDLGLGRAKLLHGTIAEAFEQYWGARAVEHSGELAYHYARATSRELAEKAIRYLASAGRDALLKYSNREAADYLQAALERSAAASKEGSNPALLEDLARARQRLGDLDGAVELWNRRLTLADEINDLGAVARSHRRLGLIARHRGRFREALDHFETGIDAAGRAGDEALQARIHLARGECSMELGRSADARREIEAALEIAERRGWTDLLARVHLALLLLHAWTGPPEQARSHGQQALAITASLGDPGLLCTVHWGMAVLSGLTGDAVAIAKHIAEGDRLAEALHSPLHRLRLAEPAIEFMASTGDWSAATELAERSISAARALNQRSSLARLLVWSGLIHLSRGDLSRGKRYVEEAWEISGAGTDQPSDVHTLVPAHVGVAGYHLAVGDYREAVRVAEKGLTIADGTGYTVWAIHRLLPTLAEAYLMLGDLEGAARIGQRLRTDSERLGHELGLAWADACDALLVWLRGDVGGGVERLRAAAERLEAVPAIPDANRLRRHFAARLRDHGQREAALRELRQVHEVFLRLGAERELAKTREQIRELGARPPVKESAPGVEGLSGRELEIAVLVAQGKSNKTIGKVLDISPRTVSTHLSNIFAKLEVASRGELAEFVRREQLAEF